jgi:uncharacterized protein
MHRATFRAALAAVALAVPAAHADFNAALADYKAGHYDSARRAFSTMAELGDCSSQFNLGVMVQKGQGGPKDVGAGVGWFKAAAANGCQELVGSRVAALEGALSAPEQQAAADILARYGHEALRAQGVVDPALDCRERVPAVVLQAPSPEYPSAGKGRNALVVGELTVGVDGFGRDPQILLSVPDPAFAAAAIEAWMHSRFTPATRNGTPVESRQQLRLPFNLAGAEPLWKSAPYKDMPAAAEAGDAQAGYQVGVAATADSSLGIGPVRGTQLVIDAARDGNPRAQYWLAAQLRAVRLCHPESRGTVWLEHAAAGGEGAAQLAFATDLTAGTPSAQQVARAHALLESAAASDSYYVLKHVLALFAASPLEPLRDVSRAQQLAARLAAGDVQSDPQLFEALAAAAAAAGELPDAIARQQTAIRKAHDLGWNTHAMEQRLVAYKDHQAWRGDLFGE